MNRKLIRPTLAEVKGREPAPNQKERRKDDPANRGASAPEQPQQRGAGQPSGSSNNPPRGQKRVPPAETNAEFFYYKKQMDSHTLMVIVLQDGEELEGTIEWYDRHALKVNRKSAPNVLLLKHNIKYMYKADERENGKDEEAST